MTLPELERIRASIQAQCAAMESGPAAPGQEASKHLHAIELHAAIRTMDQVIAQERASVMKPSGALGPTLVGV